MKRKLKTVILVTATLLILLGSLLFSGLVMFFKYADHVAYAGGESYGYYAVERDYGAFLQGLGTLTYYDDFCTVQDKLGKADERTDPNSNSGLIYDFGVCSLIIRFDWKRGYPIRILSSIAIAEPFFIIWQMSFADEYTLQPDPPEGY